MSPELFFAVLLAKEDSRIVSHLKDFILEFGHDFTFVGEEYRVQVGNTDFFIDLKLLAILVSYGEHPQIIKLTINECEIKKRQNQSSAV